MKILIIILLLLFFTFIFYFYFSNYKYIKTGDTRFCILLTTCVRSSKKDDPRFSYYIKAISKWIQNTSLPIFIVESSNYSFPEFDGTRVQKCTFDLKNLNSSTQYESQSILYAMNRFKDKMEQYTHVLKVTGRYYLPDIENILDNIPDASLICQSSYSLFKGWQNSEIFGFKKELANDIFIKISKDGGPLMEKHLYDLTLKMIYTRLPSIPNIDKVKRGGDENVVDPL